MGVDTDHPTDAGRHALVRQAFWLVWATAAWLLIEAGVALWSGIVARSLSLIAFGADSGIELLSAGVLIWRLTVEIKRGQEFAEDTERMASRIGGALLFALAAYVVVAAAWSLWTRQGGEFSVPGLVVTVLAIPIMDRLSRHKLRVADTLGSRALRADAIESVTCMYLAIVVVAALLAQFLLDRLHIDGWWIGPVASLGIVWFVIREAREAWSGEDDSDDE